MARQWKLVKMPYPPHVTVAYDVLAWSGADWAMHCQSREAGFTTVEEALKSLRAVYGSDVRITNVDVGALGQARRHLVDGAGQYVRIMEYPQKLMKRDTHTGPVYRLTN